MRHFRRMAALEHVLGLLNWDQETQMPPKGGDIRVEEVGAVAAAHHAALCDPRIEDWAASCGAAEPGSWAEAHVAEALRLHRRAVRLPATLAEDLARQSARAQMIWEKARPTSDLGVFLPELGKLVALKRQEAECLRESDQPAYDALLAEFEPGASSAEIEAVFTRLRAALVSLRARIEAAGGASGELSGSFPAEQQLALAHRVAGLFGYDWAAGRLDLAVHPSSSGTGGDVRITTRIDEANPQDCFYSTIHEVGHAVYEQGLDPEQLLLPAGGHASMGVHESQSRLFENQLGRSRAFCEWLYPAMTATFGETGLSSPEALYRAVNAVRTGFIRTEADEVHYNLHIMMRFDLERDLISGALDVSDLPEAWNSRFEADFGMKVPDAARGCMQDVHWSAGLFGYFPTYALGNIYAGELHAALRRDMPDLDTALGAGEIGGVRDWLGARIHRLGRKHAPAALIAAACGAEPSEGALLGYLEEKYWALYGV
ncbi:carboxypeptidase M32 [Amaricoccus macauensis]|uniref:carboxypeptidase M32 n=1 Tax=Amaricoccus macauensis TaxID=57001 RepID=UPI003C7EBC32